MLIAIMNSQGLGHRQDSRSEYEEAEQLRRPGHYVRLRGDYRWEEADGDYQPDARKRQVSSGT